METSDDFARELIEDAKRSLQQAKSSTKDVSLQRHLRHSLMSAFSFLELQIELISQHFDGSSIFSVHEQGILAQKEVVFDKGVFRLKERPRYSRLADRMLLLQSKFRGSRLSEREWWGPLLTATEHRNSIAHPKAPIKLTIGDVERALTAALACANDLFEIVFSKGLPYASFGLKPKS